MFQLYIKVTQKQNVLIANMITITWKYIMNCIQHKKIIIDPTLTNTPSKSHAQRIRYISLLTQQLTQQNCNRFHGKCSAGFADSFVEAPYGVLHSIKLHVAINPTLACARPVSRDIKKVAKREPSTKLFACF